MKDKDRKARLPGMVESYRSNHRPAAWPWIPGTGQSMSPGLGAIFSIVMFEQIYPMLQQMVFSHKQEGVGDEAARISFREPGFRLEILSLFKIKFLGCLFFIFAPEYGIITYKFCPVSKSYFQGGAA